MTAIEILQDLGRAECRCGNYKRKGYSLCAACYARLPLDLQRPLYQRMGAGYEEAYLAALNALGLAQPSQGSLVSPEGLHPDVGVRFKPVSTACTCGRGAIDLDPSCPLHGDRRASASQGVGHE